MSDHGPELRDEEEIRLRRCPVLYGPSSSFVGRERDLARLRERLIEHRFVIVKPASAGLGATRLAAEFAHASKSDYPGGAVWVRHHGSSPKEAVADVVEALGLPTSSWLHWPFIGTDRARGTMWRGLASRPQTLVVVDGWPPWAAPADWTAPQGDAHVVAVADASTSLDVDESVLFIVEPLERDAVEAAIREAVHDRDAPMIGRISEVIDGDALSLRIALARLRDANTARLDAYAVMLDGRDRVVTEAFEALAPDAQTLFMALACLAAGPVPMSVVRPLWAALAPSADDAGLARALGSIVAFGLATRTALDEPSAHRRTLEIVRNQKGTWEPLYPMIAAVLAEQLDALEHAHVHKARRIATHARFAAWLLERFLPPTAYESLLAAIARCPRPFESSEAARKRVTIVRTIEDPPGPRTLDALRVCGHALTQMRELAEAQTILREAVEVAERVHGADSLEVAGALDLLERAVGLGSCGQSPPEVIELNLRALGIRERTWGKDDPRLLDSLWSAGLSLATADRAQDALDLFDRAIAIAERDGVRRIADYLSSKAMMLAKLNRIDEALDTIDRAIAVQRKNERAMFVVSLVWCAEEFLGPARRLDELLARVDDVLSWPELRSEADADDNAQTVAKLHAIRARTLHALGRRDEASQAAAVAVRTFELLYPANDRRVASLRELIEPRDGAR